MKTSAPHILSFKKITVFILVLNILDILHHLSGFGYKYTDGDQTLFWLFAKDISEGIFKSPYLYGQNYNIPLESFLSAPLIYLGISPEIALPSLNILISYIPYFLFAFYFYRQDQRLSSLLFMSMPLLLPSEWQMIATMPRGFMGGIFLSTLALFLIFISQQKTQLGLALFLSCLALMVNPNATLLLVPFGLYFLLYEFIFSSATSFILPVIIALLLSLFCYFSLHYYTSNYIEVIHPAWKLEWNIQHYLLFFKHFNLHFKGVVPWLYEAGATVILWFTLLIFAAKRIKKKKFTLLLFFTLVFLLISFGFNKVQDGTGSVFFPYSRMFLAFPLVLLLLFSETERYGILLWNKFNIKIFMLIISVSWGVKQGIMQDRIDRNIRTNSGIVQVKEVAKLKQDCHEIAALAREQQSHAIIFLSKADIYNYGCPCINEMHSFYPAYERRTWLNPFMLKAKSNDMLFLDWEMSDDYGGIFYKISDVPWPAYLYTGEKRSLEEVLESYLSP